MNNTNEQIIRARQAKSAKELIKPLGVGKFPKVQKAENELDTWFHTR